MLKRPLTSETVPTVPATPEDRRRTTITQPALTLRGALQIKPAAEYLGVSVMTVKRLVSRGLLRPNRSLRHLLFPIWELNRFLDNLGN
jgi:excisionase family DNA binding protein